jgi:hypothetical protein
MDGIGYTVFHHGRDIGRIYEQRRGFPADVR